MLWWYFPYAHAPGCLTVTRVNKSGGPRGVYENIKATVLWGETPSWGWLHSRNHLHFWFHFNLIGSVNPPGHAYHCDAEGMQRLSTTVSRCILVTLLRKRKYSYRLDPWKELSLCVVSRVVPCCILPSGGRDSPSKERVMLSAADSVLQSHGAKRGS